MWANGEGGPSPPRDREELMATATPDSKSAADVASMTSPEFDTVRRGYDPGQVLAYLRVVADRIQTLEVRVRQLGYELDEARRQRDEALASATAGSDPYEGMSARLADLMRSFDGDVERLRGEAQAEADRIVAEATTEGDRARADAESVEREARVNAERLVREAREEADRITSDLTALRKTAMDKFRMMRDRMLKSAQELEGVLEKDPSERVVVLEEADTRRTSMQEPPAFPEMPSDLRS
jgi:DivIVA domain-containing protein